MRLPTSLAPRSIIVCACAVLLASPATWPVRAAEPDPVDFNRDIRPILSDTCYKCHGPDPSHRESGLRLDTHEGALAEADSGEPAVVPGQLDESALYARITAEDEDERMPPVDSGKHLTTDQIDLLRRWIEEGAPWQGHWAFVAPERPAPPATSNSAWAQGPLDQFILARLEKQGLQPSPEADKVTLIRRVTFDLTGLPPTPEEVDRFLADDSPQAYERLVDRLLASERYGEHMTRFWLDTARYGDTHGLHLDNYREMWPYRDAVIRAFNENMPWDQFVIKQLAGDLLPQATLRDRVFSGYNRLHVTTAEGGSIQEEVYVRNVVDRVSTTGTVFLGLTTGCAVCHDHKFDPLTAKDFYSLFAFFNNMDGSPLDGNAKAPAPVATVPSPEQRRRHGQLSQQMAAMSKRMSAPLPEIDAQQTAWESKWHQRLHQRWRVIQPVSATAQGGAQLVSQPDDSLLATGANPAKDVYEIVARTDARPIAAIRLEGLTDPSLPGQSNGRAGNGNAVLSEFELAVRPAGQPDAKWTEVSFVAATADHSQDKFPIANAIDGIVNQKNGWAVEGHNRKETRTAEFTPASPLGFPAGTELRFRLRFESHYGQHALGRVRLSLSTDGSMLPLKLTDWYVLGRFDEGDPQVAYNTDYGPEKDVDLGKTYRDGKLSWQPRPEAADGKPHPLPGGVGAWYLYRTIYAPGARTIKASLGSDDAIRVWLNGEVVHENNVARAVGPDQDQAELELQAGQNHLLLKIIDFGGDAGFYFRAIAPPQEMSPQAAPAKILALPADQRSPQQRDELRRYYRRTHSPAWAKMAGELERLKKTRDQLSKSFPTTLVMKERAKPRPAYILKRGQYDQPDKETGPLQRVVPPFLPPLPEGAPANRLGFAQWLVAPSHPLMARVTVNRFWQQYFGRGIVETAEDFGSQGSWPTHPRLLDWLAVEFRESGWDVKRLMKTIVMSSTYRQSSHVTPQLVAQDPQNLWLARGPRFRLDAEMLRDQALQLSGLLVNKMGGPGVKPPQPAGLWKAVAYTDSNTATFQPDKGPDKVHRRSIYTFWKRTAPPPQMSIFDAPSRESCVVRRERTNTPLQALLLLNDPQYFEAARNLAQRCLTQSDGSPAQVVSRMFRLATSRAPEPAERDALISVYEDSVAKYRSQPQRAAQLLAVGELPADAKLDAAQLAAWTLVANAVLNLDEVLTKQ